KIVAAGRSWTLHFTKTGSQTSYIKVWLVGFAGSGVSLFLFGLFSTLLFTRFKERQVAALATELKRSENEYRLLIENSHDIIYTLTAEGAFTFVSPAWNLILGHPTNQIIGQSLQQFIHPEDSEVFKSFMSIVIGKGQRHKGVEYRVRNVEGSWCWHTTTAVPLKSEDGTVFGYEGIARDITDRKKVEEEQRQLSKSIEQISEAVMIAKTDGTIIYVNPAFEKITGYSRAEALGKNPRILKSGRHDEAFYRELWGTLGKGDVWAGHLFNRKKDGAIYEEEATISPVHDAAGKIVSYVAVKRDVTPEMVLQRQLLQAQKLESVGRLAGGVAHDFNNLLMVVGGYASLLMKRLPEEDPGHLMLHEISRAVARGAALTQQLLAFGRKQVVQIRQIQLNTVIEESENMLKQLLREDIHVVLKLAPDLVPVMGDSNRIGQCLMNLMINARDAMPKGGTLTVETSNVDSASTGSLGFEKLQEGMYAMLSVRDNGVGMTLEVQSHLFEPFYTTKDRGKGSGLGLSIVHGIVKQHGGHLAVHSQVGEGTVFRILLPKFQEKTSSDRTPSKLDKKSKSGKETILLVEDEEALRKVTTEILRSAGYRVIHASGAEEALGILREPKNIICLMLSDVVMPGMQGTELSEVALGLRPTLKVALMSGYSDDRIMERVVSQKNVTFLPKPISDDQLLRKLREMIEGGPSL
ncbi:MAG: PAS domain S-box protein, partial [Verrucomicrobiia bacterium]